jgi:hypothetical protein
LPLRDRRVRFNDTKGGVADIVNGHSIIEALRAAQSVRPVLLLTSKDFGNRDTNEMAALADLLDKAMPLKDVVGSFSYVFTSGWNDSHRMTRHEFCTTFSNILRTVGQEDKSDAAETLAADLLCKLENHPHDHVNSIDVSRPEQRVDILDYIYETPPIDRPSEVFRRFVPPEAVQALHEQCGIVCLKIKLSVKGKRPADDVVSLLQQLLDAAVLLGDESVAREHREALEGVFEALSDNVRRFKQTLGRVTLMKLGVDRKALGEDLCEAFSCAEYVMRFRSIHAAYKEADLSFVLLSGIRDCAAVLLKRVSFAPSVSVDWNVEDAASASTAHTVLGCVWAVFRDFVAGHFERGAQDIASLVRGADEQLQNAFDACAEAMNEAARQQSDARAVVKAAGVLQTLAQSASLAVPSAKGALAGQHCAQMQALQSTLSRQLDERMSGVESLYSELPARLGAGVGVGSVCRFVDEACTRLVDWHKWLMMLKDVNASQFVDPDLLLAHLHNCVLTSLRAGVQQAKGCVDSATPGQERVIAVWCYSVDKLRYVAQRVDVPAVEELVNQSIVVDGVVVGFLTERVDAAKRSLEHVQERALRGFVLQQAYTDLSSNLSAAASIAASFRAMPMMLAAFACTCPAAEDVIGRFGQYAATFRQQCLEDGVALAAISHSAGPRTGRWAGNVRASVPLSKLGTPALAELLLLQSDGVARLGRVAQLVRDYDVVGADLAGIIPRGAKSLAQFFEGELRATLSADEVEDALAALDGGRRDVDDSTSAGSVFPHGEGTFPRWSLSSAHEACLAHANAQQLLSVMLAVGQPSVDAAAAAAATKRNDDGDDDDDGVDLLAQVAAYEELLRCVHTHVSAFCRETASLLGKWRSDGFHFTSPYHAELGRRAALLGFVGEICRNSQSQLVQAEADGLAASLEQCDRWMAGGFRDCVADTCSSLRTAEAPSKVETKVEELLGLLQHLTTGPWAASYQALSEHRQQQQAASAAGAGDVLDNALAVASASVLSTLASIVAETAGRSASTARSEGKSEGDVSRSSWSLHSLHLATQARLQQAVDPIDCAELKSLLEVLHHFQRLDGIADAKLKFEPLHQQCSVALSKAETDFQASLKLALGRYDFKQVKDILLRNTGAVAKGDTVNDIAASLGKMLTQIHEALALFADEATPSLEPAKVLFPRLAQLGCAAVHLSADVFCSDDMTALLAEGAQLQERGHSLVQERISRAQVECRFALSSLQFDKFESGCTLVREWLAAWNSAHSAAVEGYTGQDVRDCAAAAVAALDEAKDRQLVQLQGSFDVELSVQLLQKQASPKDICRALHSAKYNQDRQQCIVRFRAVFVDAIAAVRKLSAEDIPADRENLVKYLAANSSELFPKELLDDVKQKALECERYLADAFDAAADRVTGAIATFEAEATFKEYWSELVGKLQQPRERRPTAAQLDRCVRRGSGCSASRRQCSAGERHCVAW